MIGFFLLHWTLYNYSAWAQGIVKGTVVRGDDLCPNGELRVSDCHDMVLYALTPLKTVSIFGCSDATIVIGKICR